MGVYELSGAGSVKTPRTLYTSMNAGNMYGAMVPINGVQYSTDGQFAFTNLPQTFQDLRIVCFLRSTRAGAATDNAAFWFGPYGANNYSETWLVGDGSTAASSRGTNAAVFVNSAVVPAATATSGVYAAVTIDILNYANTSTFKTVMTRCAADANGSGTSRLAVGLYSSTSAISSFAIVANNGVGQNFLAGSSVYIYGIRAVSS